MKNKVIKFIMFIIICVCCTACVSSVKYTTDYTREESFINTDDTFDVYSFIEPPRELIFYNSKNKCNIIYCNL